MLGHTGNEGAAVGEVLTAGDPNSWHYAVGSAARVAATARRSQDTGHPISARDSWLRASTYHRISDFYLHADRTTRGRARAPPGNRLLRLPRRPR